MGKSKELSKLGSANSATLQQLGDVMSLDASDRLTYGRSGSDTDMKFDIDSSVASVAEIEFQRDGVEQGSIEYITNATLADSYLRMKAGSNFGFKMDGSGRVSMPYQPAFLAYNAPTISSSAYRIYSQTSFNVGSAYSTSNGRFTAPVAGRYMFAFSDLITTPSTTSYAHSKPYINGVHFHVTVHTSYSSTRSYEPLGGTLVADMNAGDYMQIYTSISGSSTYGGTYNWFSGHLIG